MPAKNPQAHLVDLRSDTVTRPTPAMYEAMVNAPLGDDVLGDDPTVLELEALAAKKLGKDAAVFVPSGHMGNEVSLLCHCQRGDGIIVEQESHIVCYELGASAVLAGAVTWTLPSKRGVMDPDQIEARIMKADDHTPGTVLLCVENTHNRHGGVVIPLSVLEAYRELSDRRGLKVHLDGARVFNAAVALGVPVTEITQYVDSVTFCLSKGLGSPVGSVVCGTSDFIDKARIWRKRLGGGTRQAGVLAACGIVSLTQMVDRLSEDHDRAKKFANEVSQLPGVKVDLTEVDTNMVRVFTDQPAAEWQKELGNEGLLCFAMGPSRLRLVFHVDVDDAKLERGIEIFRSVAERMAPLGASH